MPKLPNKINLRIMDFERFGHTNKFKGSWRYMKVDIELLDEMHYRGLKFDEMIVFERLYLIALRQRCERISVFCDSFKPFIPDFEKILRRLISKDFVELSNDNLLKYNLKYSTTKNKPDIESLDVELKKIRMAIK